MTFPKKLICFTSLNSLENLLLDFSDPHEAPVVPLKLHAMKKLKQSQTSSPGVQIAALSAGDLLLQAMS
jgi:hypothetical protein